MSAIEPEQAVGADARPAALSAKASVARLEGGDGAARPACAGGARARSVLPVVVVAVAVARLVRRLLLSRSWDDQRCCGN